MPDKLNLASRPPALELNEASTLGLDESPVPESPSQLARGVELENGVRIDENARLARSPKSDDAGLWAGSLRVSRQLQFNASDQRSCLAHQVFSILFKSRHGRAFLRVFYAQNTTFLANRE